MTAPTPPAPAQGRSRVPQWIAFTALALGAIVAVLGVWAGVTAIQRQQRISDYTHARSTAAYFVKNGDTVSVAMKRLQVLDQEDLALMNEMRSAEAAGNASRFNTLAESSNTRNDEQALLRNQVKAYQAAFAKAYSQ